METLLKTCLGRLEKHQKNIFFLCIWQKQDIFNKLREQEYFRSKGEKRRIAKAAGKARAKKEAQRKLEEYGF